jgi:hypothetical protein
LARFSEQGKLEAHESDRMCLMSKFLRSVTRSLRFSLCSLAIAALCPAAQAIAGERSSAVAGRYTVLRADDKDTGCMVTLDDRARGPGGYKAQLAPACRDNGLVVFDPVGWSIERGRLVLTARKGHKARFDLQADGIWRRDAKEGKALSLKRL